MSGYEIQQLLAMYDRDSIETVQCLYILPQKDNQLFTPGTRYKIEGNRVTANDGEHYHKTAAKFGNPVFKGEIVGKLGRTSLKDSSKPEDSGGSCDYYKVLIENPTTAEEQYTAECNDVIEALDMTYAEANMFKEIWRSAAARTLGKLKAGHNEVRGAEKIEFFAKRNAIQKGVKQ